MMIIMLRNCFYQLLIFFLLLGMLGCGGDEEDPVENLVGSWELITIDGKTPKEDAQEDDEDIEIRSAARKYVFASDGSLFAEISMSFSFQQTTLSAIPGFNVEYTINYRFTVTINGNYVVSGSTLEFIIGDRVNAEVDFSINTGGIPELERLEQELKQWAQEWAQEFEQEFKQEWELKLETYTWELEEDLLTLRNGSEEVYRKK